MNTRKARMAFLVRAAGLSGTVQTTLIDCDSDLIYDDVQNVTWLADAKPLKNNQ